MEQGVQDARVCVELKKTRRKKAMTLKQDISNVLRKVGLRANADYDLIAIQMLNSGIKLSEKDVDRYLQHCLTYIHPKIDNCGVGWMSMIGVKHDDPKTIAYLNGVFSCLKKVVRSFDSKLASSIFKDKHLEAKYHLGNGLKITRDTLKFVASCKIAKSSAKKVEAQIDKNIEIQKKRIKDLSDKAEACKEIGSAKHSELDDVVKPLFPIEDTSEKA